MIRLKRALVFALVHGAKWVRTALLATPRAERFLRPGFEPLLWRIGTWRLWLAVEHARKHVPAYRRLLSEHGDPQVRVRGLVPDFSALPITDKESYVLRFSTEERCRHGHIPPRGVVIDESSGTSGTSEQLGARAGGARRRPQAPPAGPCGRCSARSRSSSSTRSRSAHGRRAWPSRWRPSTWPILKSVGPDVGKIEATLRQFGPRYRYLVLGYPPFLKQLVDEARIDWSEYDCAAVVGGEGMSEALRSYLLRRFRAVYSSFGAADLEINIAAENDFAIALRRLLAERPELGHALGLPVPLLAADGLPVQPARLRHRDQRVRRARHLHLPARNDGAQAPLQPARPRLPSSASRDVERALAELGLRPADLAERHLDLPLLFHYGRSDATVAFYGANVAPADVQEVVYSLPELAERVGAVRAAPRRGRGGQQDARLRLRARGRRRAAGGRRGDAGALPRSPEPR